MNKDIWDETLRKGNLSNQPFKLKRVLSPPKFTMPKYPTPIKKDSPLALLMPENKQKRRQVIKREFYFDPDNLPENYSLFIDETTEALFKKDPAQRKNPYNYPVGATSFDNFFSNEELCEIEKNVESTEDRCKDRAFLPMTAQQTYNKQG